jgi:DNA-directed RNA polymerase specialized sigma24 family protein
MPTRTLKTDPIMRARRAALRAFWEMNPATPARDVAARFGVSESTALDAKPYHLRSIKAPLVGRPSEAEQLARRLYEADWPLAEIAEATGRSVKTTRRYLRAVTKGQP